MTMIMIDDWTDEKTDCEVFGTPVEIDWKKKTITIDGEMFTREQFKQVVGDDPWEIAQQGS